MYGRVGSLRLCRREGQMFHRGRKDTQQDARALATGLVGQFVLSIDSINAPTDWMKNSIGRWQLLHHPALPVTNVIDADGLPVAKLLGHPLHRDRVRWTLPFAMREVAQ